MKMTRKTFDFEKKLKRAFERKIKIHGKFENTIASGSPIRLVYVNGGLLQKEEELTMQFL